MTIEDICVDENTMDKIVSYEINEEISIYVSLSERVATIFYNDIELIVRVNNFVHNVIEQLQTASYREQIMLLQILKNIALVEEELNLLQ